MNNDLSIFLDQVKSRSVENREAFKILLDSKLYGVAIGLLRQELDSLIRISYLWQPETPVAVSQSLIEKSVRGKMWKVVNHNGKEVKVTDRDMLNLASHLGGWEQTIYSFGCKLIHLSDYHLYLDKDPFDTLSNAEKEEIIGYLSAYHDYSKSNIRFNDLVEYLPKIMVKLTDNVEFYIEELPEKMDGCYENP
ncbi:hypothetical protein ACJJIF_06300 [Microbulbifer sp. SSSA002]|uniref:hypothetical protein n=1 Tax=Microbulbifer sp. SSSA002 TaxID=3243376 RepID=UPI004039D904